MNVHFSLVKEADNRTGQKVDTLTRVETDDAGNVMATEAWCTVPELDTLFQTASDRWGDGNWDLNKILVAIREAEFD